MKTFKKLVKWFLFAVWVYFLVTIRVRDYGRYPFAGHADELNYGWSGISLIQDGKPFGWSYHSAYPKEWVFYDGVVDKNDPISVGGRMVRPWLDEPPLFSLMAGGVAHLYGDKAWSVLPASHIRLPSIIFGLLTTLILFLWAYEWYGIKIGMGVATIYTLTPVILFGSRMALPENGISFILILCLYLFFRKQSKNIGWGTVVAVSVLSGLAGLMKPTGFFIIFLFIFWLIKYKLYKKSIFSFVFILPFVALFLWYGFWQGGSAFWGILKTQGFRPTGWTALSFILSTPIYSTNADTIYDGWYIFLLIGSLLLAAIKWKDKKINILSMAFLYWLAIIVISAGEQDALAWYRYPLFPLISFLGTLLIARIIKRPNLVWGFVTIGLLLSSRFYLHNAFNPTTSTYVFKILCVLLAAPFVMYEIYKTKLWLTLSRAVMIGVICFGLFLNARFIYSAYTVKCQALVCPMQQETKLSKLKLPFMHGFPLPYNY